MLVQGSNDGGHGPSYARRQLPFPPGQQQPPQQQQHHRRAPRRQTFEGGDMLAAGHNGTGRIEDYEITRAIGKGKFAIVYRAKRKEDGTNVALKRISMPAMDEKSRTKCMREVRLLQSLDHCNIVRYVDFFLEGACEEDNKLVIVVEWAAAGDLKRQVRKALEREVHFEERIIWGYFSQICGAISYMHQQRIMHRDLKPANIFLNLKGQVKVGDLGLGRLMTESKAEEALAYSKVGTPLYMSPEVLRGGGYSWNSDIWSLGCILYELAMLRSPFKSEGLNLYTLFQKICSGNYPAVLGYYSDDLKALARGMISTNPNVRPNADEAFSVALSMKERIDSMGRPANPPETAVHLKPKTSPTKKKAAADKGKDKTARAAAVGVNKDWRPAFHACARQASREASCPMAAAGGDAPTAGGAAVGAREGGHYDPTPTGGGHPPGCKSGPLCDRSAPASRGAFGDEDGGSNLNNPNQRGGHHHHHHHHHHINHHHNCYHGSNDKCRVCRRQEGVDRSDQQHQHQHHHLQHQHHQHHNQRRDGYDAAAQTTEFVAHRGSSSGSNKSRPRSIGGNSSRSACRCDCKRGKTAATGVSAPQPPGAGPTEKEEQGQCAIATAVAETRPAKATFGDQFRPEQCPAGVPAPLLTADQIAPPPSLPVPAGVTAASGLSLPKVRAGMTAKAKAARAKAAKAEAAKAEAAVPEEAAVAVVAALGSGSSVVVEPNDLTPSKVNSGGDPRWSQVVEVGSGWEVGSRVTPVATTWKRPPASTQVGQPQQHEQHPQPAARSRSRSRTNTNEDAPAAAAAAEVVARVFPLPAVVVGRRPVSDTTATNTTTSTTSTPSSPSSSSPSSGRGRRGREEERNPNSGGSGSGSGNGSGSGSGSGSRSGGDGGGEGGGGGRRAGRERNDDVEMMMTAETNSSALKDGNDGDDDGNQDGQENSNLRRAEERRERRRKRSDHNNKHPSSHRDSGSKLLSPVLRSSPRAAGEGAGGEGVVVRPTQEGSEAAAAPTTTTTLGRVRGGSMPQRCRRGGSTASTIADAAAAATAAAVAASAAAAAAASAATAAAAVAKSNEGSQVVVLASGSGSCSADQRVAVSADNLVAMEALLDRLSVLGYDNALRNENKPPLSRLHFVVPGGSDSSSSSGGGGERMVFPSRREQFLGFAALSEWLLEQLGNGDRVPTTTTGVSSSDAPIAVCANILRGCQGLGFEPSSPESGAVAEATAVSPANLAIGSGHAVLELLGWLSKAALNKVESKSANGARKTTRTRGEGTMKVVPGDGDGQRAREGKEREKDRQQTDCSDGRTTQDGEGDGNGVFVRRGRSAVAGGGGGPALPDDRRTGRWRNRGRGCWGERIKASCRKMGEQAAADSSTPASAGAADNNSSNNKKASSNESGRNDGSPGGPGCGRNDRTTAVPAAGAFRGNSNTSSHSNSSSRSSSKRQHRRGALPPEVVVMMTTAVVSSSAFWSSASSSSSSCSCSPVCSCSRPRSRRRFWSSSPSSATGGSSDGDGSSGGGGGGGEEEEEGPQTASCVWGKDTSVDGFAFMGSMVDATVDPDVWRLEYQRVAPRLARAAAAGQGEHSKDSWAYRLGVLGAAAVAIMRETVGSSPLPPAVPAAATPPLSGRRDDGDGGCGGMGRGRAYHVAARDTKNVLPAREDRCESMLAKLGGDLSRQLESVAAGERTVNASRQVGGGGGGGGGEGGMARFREEVLLLRAEEASVREELAGRQARVAALIDDLCDAEDAVEEMDNNLADTADEYSDATRQCQAKSAIRQLKADVKAMDVLIGAKSATLMRKQLGRQHAARKTEVRAPVGSRWGGLNARAHGRGSGNSSSSGSGSGCGGQKWTASPTSSRPGSPRLLTSASASTFPVTTSAAVTAPTSAVSTPSSDDFGGSEGGAAKSAWKPRAEAVGDGGGMGQGIGSRRSNVLMQEAMHLLTTRPVRAVPEGGRCGGGEGRCSSKKHCLEEKKEREGEEGAQHEDQDYRQQPQHQHGRASAGRGGRNPIISSSSDFSGGRLSWNSSGKDRVSDGGRDGWREAAAW